MQAALRAVLFPPSANERLVADGVTGRTGRMDIGIGAGSGARRHQRLGFAALVSLLLHGAAVTAWHLHSPPQRRTPPAARQAMQVQWITATPQARLQRAPAAGAETFAKDGAALRGPVRTANGPQRRPDAATRAPAQAGRAQAVQASVPHFAGAQPTLEAPTPQRPASHSGADDAPVRWSPEAVGRADRQERRWQQRHGSGPAAAQLAAATESASPGTPLGGSLSAREWRGGDGARVAQVQGPDGSSYCVRLPSANRLPDQGAAPRVAPVSNCP
jgi:hypothetical protein